MSFMVRQKHLKGFYCNNGTRKFFDQHGLSWYEFRHHGIPEEKLIETGDHMAIELVRHAKKIEGVIDGKQ